MISLRLRPRTVKPFVIMLAVFGSLALFQTVLNWLNLRMVLNVTLSAPRGIYLVDDKVSGRLVSVGDYVEFSVPQEFRSMVYGRRWLRDGTPLLKPIKLLGRGTVCTYPTRFTINGVDAGPIYSKDSQGFAIPLSLGCKEVRPGYFLPISIFNPRSFDGRYMGPLPIGLIRGKATPIWIF
jgi:type IV secretory pathway protease TraF